MQTYLFDFDGTLVDSMPTYIAAMLQILEENRIPYKDNLIRIITPLGLAGTAAYYRSELGLTLPQETIMERMRELMLDAYLHRIPAKPQVFETLRQLKARGDSLNVLTASPHITLDACLKRLGLFDLFDHIWSCDDFGTTKADPDIYRQAAAALQCPVDGVLFLDDNLNALCTAREAGMNVCGVYDSSSAEYTAEIKAVGDHYISDFSELLLF